MSDASAAPAAPAAPPVTIGSVRDTHLALMREWRTLTDTADKAARAAAFREQVQHAGCDLADPADRDEAQGILDYWSSAVAALPDQPYPAFVALDDYVGEAGTRAGENAREVYQSLASEAEKRAARSLFEDLLSKGPHGVERFGARTRMVLAQRIRISNLDALLDAFAATGAITRRPGKTPADDQFEITDTNLVKAWPELDEWLSDRQTYERRRDILLNRAQQWECADRRAVYLARGEDLRDIDRFAGETDTLDEFIAASKRGKRWFLSFAVAAAFIAGAVFLFLSWQTSQKFAAQRDAARAEASEVKALLAEKEAKRDAQTAQEQHPTAESILKPADAPPISVGALPRLGLPKLEGAIWLGSDQRPQVSAPTWGRATLKPSAAKAGVAYRVLANINLRQGMPVVGGPYVSPPQQTVLSAGTLLILTGAVQGYNRPTGRQFWAKVQVVPRLYVQYTRLEKPAVERLRKRLSQFGFDVPAAERIASAKGLREVRYFDEDDRPIAELLLRRLGSDAGGEAGQGPFACRSFAGSRASNRYALELWLDPAAAARAGPAACQ